VRLNAKRIDPNWKWRTGGWATWRRMRLAGRHLDFCPDTLETLRAAGALRERCRAVVPVPPPAPASGGCRALCLILTNSCNLACSYCYVRDRCGGSARSGGAPPDLMHDRTVCRAFDLLPVEMRGPYRVSFFGGEPLLAWAKLRWAVERARARFGTGVRFHLTTNGTLLSQARAEWLVQEGFSMIVSLDGPRALHDAHRRDAKGWPTHQRVVAALRAVAAHPELARRTALRATYLPGEAEISARLEHLNDLADELGLGGVAVEPATGANIAWPRGELARTLLEGAAWCVERARAGKSARFKHLSVTLDRLMRRRPAFSECGAGVGFLAVAPDGTVHACHKQCAPLGDLLRGLDESLVGPWRENRLTAREKCARCWARLLCGGGCRAEGFEEGLGPVPSPTACALGKARALAALWVAAELSEDQDALARIVPSAARMPHRVKEGPRDAVETVAT